MSKQSQPRNTPTKLETRLEELRALRQEIEARDEKLSAAIISEKLGISKRQAQRYLRRLEDERPGERVGEELIHSVLKSLPLMMKALREDLLALDALNAETESDRVALIKTRRDQVLALARIGSQFLKELRDLGLISRAVGSGQTGTGHSEAGLQSLSPEIQAEIDKLADEELQEFERELE